MGKSSSSKNKKMTNFKFFIIVLIISSIVTVAIAYAASKEDYVSSGLLFSVLFSFFLTLFRILKKSNGPDNRLGNWQFFFTLFVFVTGIVGLGLFFSTRFDVIPSFRNAMIVGLIISSVVSIYRAIKPLHQKKKNEKLDRERKQQQIEQLQNQNKEYADELRRKNQLISSLQGKNVELAEELRTHGSSSPSSNRSSYQNQYYAEQLERRQEERRKQEEEERKSRLLEDWYREYVTIEVSFDYHYVDSEYNTDRWERRSEEIRVTRREAMALIQAGKEAIMGRTGYHNLGSIRNISYQLPYRLYDRPWNC